METPLTRYGFHFDPACDRYLPAVDLKKTKAGKIAKCQPSVTRQPKRWWQAQCSFRGLRTGGNVEDLQQRIRQRDKSLEDGIAQEQEQLRSLVETTETKQQVKPTRSRQTARKSCFDASLPRRGVGTLSSNASDDAWSYYGEAEFDSDAKIAPPRGRTKQTARKSCFDPSLPRCGISTPGPSEKISQTTWDITGDWEISCQDFSDYGSEEDSTMEIYRDADNPGFHMAHFNFGFIEGIMRISCPVPLNSDRELQGTFVYRGRETGESEILVDSDRACHNIVFKEKGCELESVFDAPYCGRVVFRGSKIAEGSDRESLSRREWDSFSREAYEAARVSRWK
jgi:hypothetical protein